MENRALDNPYIAINIGVFTQCGRYAKVCATKVCEYTVRKMPKSMTINPEAPFDFLIPRT